MQTENENSSFEFYIKRNIDEIPSFQISNHSNITLASDNQLFTNSYKINGQNVSLHIHIKPANSSIGYLAVLNYGDKPVLNEKSFKYDEFNIFCPKS